MSKRDKKVDERLQQRLAMPAHGTFHTNNAALAASLFFSLSLTLLLSRSVSLSLALSLFLSFSFSFYLSSPPFHKGCIIARAWTDGGVEKERGTWERGGCRRKWAVNTRTAPRGTVALDSTTVSPQLFQIQMFVLDTCDLSCCAGASSCTATSYVFLCHLTCTDTVAGLSVVIITILYLTLHRTALAANFLKPQNGRKRTWVSDIHDFKETTPFHKIYYTGKKKQIDGRKGSCARSARCFFRKIEASLHVASGP